MLNKRTTEAQVYALGQHISMSAHKARRVIDQIRGRSYEETLMILELMPYRACYPIFKLVYSAAANASFVMGWNEANLVIIKAEVNEGTIVKRLKPRARGRSFAIQKPTCHISIVMKDISLKKYNKYVSKYNQYQDIDTDSITWSQKPKCKKKHTTMSYYDMYSNGGTWDKK
uniref:ribosomal protein L22 n=1 Tax=Tragopogon pratensis TaxID=41653 RepID=UPI002A7EE370|nr:ribosomal protein L22 [Tragopogon pratensis]YP_011013962.1 ribosomal protein L22 [Tragopogon dubius]WNN66983.1 ribosomal protein L22 [Tragopogon pratensis]WQA10030.1 ribosomal protein L22 [Tragopogon dubius]